MDETSETMVDSSTRMAYAIPALPIRDVEQSVDLYRDGLGFTLVHREEGFVIFQRDEVEVHAWVAADEDWRTRDTSSRPVVSGAESFIAGTASCRVCVEDVDELHRRFQPLGILHPNAPLRDTGYGTREFTVTDPDNNAIAFFGPE